MPVRFDSFSTKGKSMKPICLLAALLLGFCGLSSASGNHDHGHEHKPLHGGIVTEVRVMDYELVASTDSIQMYVRDHGKPVDVTQATAKVTLLSGSEKQDVELKAAGEKMEAKGVFKLAPGAKALILISLPGGKTTTARFVLK
jgi:hypothetical protein